MSKEKKRDHRENQQEVDNSRRSTLKQLGIGALGTVGALYGFNQSALAEPLLGTGTGITGLPGEEGIAARAANKPLKVLLINGSPRKNGNTFTALSEIAEVLRSEGVEPVMIHLGTEAVRGCIQCNACRESGICIFQDTAYSTIREQLESADGIIIGSPVYFAGPNGALCAVLDRLFYTSGSLLQYKPGSAIAVCRRAGATATLDRLNKYFTISNMLVVGSQYWNLAHGADAGEVAEDKEGLQIMRTLGRNMAWTVKNIQAGAQPVPEREKRIRTDFVKK